MTLLTLASKIYKRTLNDVIGVQWHRSSIFVMVIETILILWMQKNKYQNKYNTWSPGSVIISMVSAHYKSFPAFFFLYIYICCRIACLGKNKNMTETWGKAPKVQSGFDAFGDVTGFSSPVCNTCTGHCKRHYLWVTAMLGTSR